MKPRRRDPHPMTRLAIACSCAARNIANPIFRRNAGYEADRIPKCRGEIGGGRRGEVARMARALLGRLPNMAAEDFAEAAATLRGYAGIIGGNFELVSEVTYTGRKPTKNSHGNFAV